jgi:hypothetical protein
LKPRRFCEHRGHNYENDHHDDRGTLSVSQPVISGNGEEIGGREEEANEEPLAPTFGEATTVHI